MALQVVGNLDSYQEKYDQLIEKFDREFPEVQSSSHQLGHEFMKTLKNDPEFQIGEGKDLGDHEIENLLFHAENDLANMSLNELAINRECLIRAFEKTKNSKAISNLTALSRSLCRALYRGADEIVGAAEVFRSSNSKMKDDLYALGFDLMKYIDHVGREKEDQILCMRRAIYSFSSGKSVRKGFEEESLAKKGGFKDLQKRKNLEKSAALDVCQMHCQKTLVDVDVYRKLYNEITDVFDEKFPAMLEVFSELKKLGSSVDENRFYGYLKIFRENALELQEDLWKGVQLWRDESWHLREDAEAVIIRDLWLDLRELIDEVEHFIDNIDEEMIDEPGFEEISFGSPVEMGSEISLSSFEEFSPKEPSIEKLEKNLRDLLKVADQTQAINLAFYEEVYSAMEDIFDESFFDLKIDCHELREMKEDLEADDFQARLMDLQGKIWQLQKVLAKGSGVWEKRDLYQDGEERAIRNLHIDLKENFLDKLQKLVEEMVFFE